MTTGVRERTQEAVDALTEADDHLAFARTVLGGELVVPARRTEYDARITTITERITDPCQYLAVIGEFSSGKTTFVNALLGDALLSARPWPTTAAVTRVRAGASLQLRCRFRDESREYTFPGSGREWDALEAAVRRHLGRSACIDPADVPGMLALLTAEERVARAVRWVTVAHPADALAEGLVVIDTPGTNADAGHTDIARRVTEDEADVAVVVMASDAPLPESLIDFLRSALDPQLLRRCVFVVTKMATVEESEHDDLIRTVGDRIRSRLGVEDAVVLPVSVGAVVRDMMGRPPSEDERPWITRFRGTRAELLEILDRRRAVAVSDRVLKLLDDLLGTLRDDLAAERAIVQREQRGLATSGLADLDEFTAARRVDAHTCVTKLVRTARTTVERHLDEFERALVDATVAAVPGDTGGRRKRIDDAVAEHLATLESRYRSETAALGRATDATVRGIDTAFAGAYRRLGSLAPALAPVPANPALNVAAIDGASLEGVTQLNSRHESTENALMGTGAAAGALIGTMIMPVIGTAIGALLGSGSFLFGSAKRERAMCDEVRTSVQALAGTTRDEVLRQVDASGTAATAAVIRRMETLHTHYAPQVREAQRVHDLHCRSLVDRERNLESVLSELGRRESRLKAQRRRLTGAGDR